MKAPSWASLRGLISPLASRTDNGKKAIMIYELYGIIYKYECEEHADHQHGMIAIQVHIGVIQYYPGG